MSKPLSRAAGEMRLLLAEQGSAHDRVDAVGGDHGIGDDSAAVGEAQSHALRRLIEPDQLVVEMDPFGRHDAG
jgi:hypothetical protein